jgi:hypothetical protein
LSPARHSKELDLLLQVVSLLEKLSRAQDAAVNEQTNEEIENVEGIGALVGRLQVT